ncbi:MAG: YHYH protein [Betaproteobacteria bacterium]|nr:YHYH protein [Betaproteobacteria bacterium]
MPVSGTTGTFPVQRSDPAFQIDRNPNSIRAQELAIELPAAPRAAPQPSCVPMGPIGITLDGVLLFNALDDGGRDAVAHEVQDRCNGHPEREGRYHYHGPSPCLPGIREPEAVIGFAFDGFPITGLVSTDGREHSNADLDECHGREDAVRVDGKLVRTYHYAMTREYPYTVGCFRGTPVSLGGGTSAREPMGGERRGPMPPREAVQACEGRGAQAPCGFVSPRGDEIRGICGEPVPGVVACLPGGGRRGF